MCNGLNFEHGKLERCTGNDKHLTTFKKIPPCTHEKSVRWTFLNDPSVQYNEQWSRTWIILHCTEGNPSATKWILKCLLEHLSDNTNLQYVTGFGDLCCVGIICHQEVAHSLAVRIDLRQGLQRQRPWTLNKNHKCQYRDAFENLLFPVGPPALFYEKVISINTQTVSQLRVGMGSRSQSKQMRILGMDDPHPERASPMYCTWNNK